MTKLDDTYSTLSPEMTVRFKQGKMSLHVGRKSLQFRSPEVLLYLYSLTQAKVFHRPSSFEGLRRIDGALQEIGALVPASTQKQRTDAVRDQELPVTYLESMARLLEIVGGDLAAFGPYAQEIVNQEGMGIPERLEMILKTIQGLASDLYAERRAYLRAQFRKLGVDNESAGLKLHIGCGDHVLESWINIDRHPAQLAMDVRWGLPFRDGCVAFAFLSHALEHFYYPKEALRLLKDIKRVLQPGGVLRVIVPDIEKCLRAYVENDAGFFTNRRRTWTWWPEYATRLEQILPYAGAGSWFGSEGHKFGYDYETLRHLLLSAGFLKVERSEYMKSRHEALRIDTASRVAGAAYGDTHYSLFAEAQA
jgi:predicted SAM-dependent methyltransferase